MRCFKLGTLDYYRNCNKDRKCLAGCFIALVQVYSDYFKCNYQCFYAVPEDAHDVLSIDPEELYKEIRRMDAPTVS